MVSKCDFTSTDGTVNPNQANEAVDKNESGDLSDAALEEIITAAQNGTAIEGCVGGPDSLCDYTLDDGTVTPDLSKRVAVAQLGDRLTEDEATTLINAAFNQEPVSACVTTDQGETPEPEPPDGSSTSVSIETVTSPEPNTIAVSYTVKNTVTSGNGKATSPTVATTVDGQTVDTRSISVSAGSSRTENIFINNLDSGDAQVCVDIV